MITCNAPRRADLLLQYHLSELMRHLQTCSFSRPCASAPLFSFFLLLCVLSLFHFLLLLSPPLCSTFPFTCPIISSPLFYKLRWEAGLQEITWVLTHSLFTTTHRRTELTNYIISPRAIHNKLVMGISPVSSLLFLLGKARGNALELQWMSTLVMHADLWRCLSTKGSPLYSTVFDSKQQEWDQA